MKRNISTFALLLLSVIMAAAQASFSVQAPRQVLAGNKFSVTFRLQNGEGSSLQAPQINGCQLLFGPSKSTMQSYQIINGQASASTTVDYTYTYRADKPGTYTIPSASIVVDGKTLKTREAQIQVLPPDKTTQQSSSSQGGGVAIDDINTQTTDKKVNSDDVFIRIILSRSQAYEQEAIECTIKLYTKYQIGSFMVTTQPNFDGFLIEEVNVQAALNEMEHYNGQNYMTAVLKKCIIYPQKSGKLTINSGRYDLTVVQYERVNLGFFTQQRPVEKKIQVNSNSVSLNVLPLPQPQPEGFTGAVGKFTIDSKLNGSSFRTGEAGSLTYTISGTGNIKYIKEPVIDFPTEFEQYTPRTDISAHVAGNNMTGQVTVEYTFVPQSVGEFHIGADKFVYFDPSTKDYVTLTTPDYTVKVAKGAGSTSSSSVDKQDIKAKNTDILHIKLGDKGQQPHHTLVANTWWYWAIYLLLAIALIATLAAAAKRSRLNADITGRRIAKANSVARQRLKAANKLMKAHQSEKFYEELLRAVWGYLSDKLSIPASQLTRDNVAAELANYGAPQSLTDSLIDILDRCEMARYTPSGSDEAIEQIYNQASQAISQMSSIKPAKHAPTSRSALAIAILLATAIPGAINASSLTQQADSAYMADNFAQARDLYIQSIEQQGASSDIYYNLGNTYYRLGQPGKAILYYERALKLNPTNAQARQNLEFVNTRIIDQPGDRGSVFSKITDETLRTFSANAWAWIALGLFCLVICAVALYAFATGVMLRKLGFFGGLVILALTVIAVILALSAANRVKSHNSAIITSVSSQLSTSPRPPKDKSEQALLLHEGTKVEILDSVATSRDSVNQVWYDVAIDNAHRAWVSSNDIEKI